MMTRVKLLIATVVLVSWLLVLGCSGSTVYVGASYGGYYGPGGWGPYPGGVGVGVGYPMY